MTRPASIIARSPATTPRDAQAAAAAIRAKSMQVETERVFRSGETPQLKLATRNVPAVKVRVYKIDLETYFRKMHSIAGIQRLDVSLIDPDTTLEFAVPDYAKYKPLTSSIPVPLPDGDLEYRVPRRAWRR